MAPSERFWIRRLRWRLRGAPLWPAFVGVTLVDAVVLTLLPPLQSTGLNLIEGLLIATFGNLVLIAAAAPFLTRRLVARRAASWRATASRTGAANGSAGATGGRKPEPAASRPAPPRPAAEAVLGDRVAIALLVAGLAAIVASGLANRPVVVSETEATEAAGEAVREYVDASGSAELKRNLETANIDRLGEDYFRVCLARDDRERFFCLLVDTSEDPPSVERDPSAEPNTFESGR